MPDVALTTTRDLSGMELNPPALNSLGDLREHVHRELCEKNDFEPGAFQITERYLLTSEKPCGIYFCLHGPRSVKVTAIWDTKQNTVLYYNSTGERIDKVKLEGAAAARELAEGTASSRAA